MRYKHLASDGYNILGYCAVEIVKNVFCKVLCVCVYFVTGEFAFISLTRRNCVTLIISICTFKVAWLG